MKTKTETKRRIAIMKLTTLMLEVLADGVITPDEWELVLKTAKELIPVLPTVENMPIVQKMLAMGVDGKTVQPSDDLAAIATVVEELNDNEVFDAEEHIDKLAANLDDDEV